MAHIFYCFLTLPSKRVFSLYLCRGSEWGEDGYFRVAMNDAGCGWGLFGLLAESAVPSQAYKNLEDLPERPGWWETAQTWEKALVILFSILGFCCLCGIVGALRRRVKREE